MFSWLLRGTPKVDGKVNLEKAGNYCFAGIGD
jgi:hypothetical protein